MRCLLLYQKFNGTPRRILSLSSRIKAGKGQHHEGDDAVPREFIEAPYILSEAQRPHPGVLQQKDLTPELIAEKAKKYNIIPEDYVPMSVSWGGSFGGDYPTIVDDAYYSRDFNYEWDNFELKRNYGQVIGMHEWIAYSAVHIHYDGQFHPWGLWQWRQHHFLYLQWILLMFMWFAVHQWLTSTFFVHNAWERWTFALDNTGMRRDRSWSKTELEWFDIFEKVEQAKDGYAGKSHAKYDFSYFRVGSIWFLKYGQYSGRFRRGPTGEAPMLHEKVDSYMCPAGPMSFKMGHNMPLVNPSFLVWREPHINDHAHGDELADMLSTEVGRD